MGKSLFYSLWMMILCSVKDVYWRMPAGPCDNGQCGHKPAYFVIEFLAAISH